MNIHTKAVHAGDRKKQGAHIPVTTPIYTASSFVYEDIETTDKVFAHEVEGYAYARYDNPTNHALEELCTPLESGHGSLACATGMAALEMALCTALIDRRKKVVAANALYGATINLLMKVMEPFGIETTFVDPDDPENFRRAVKPNTKLVYAETLGNPLINLIDIEAIAKIAHEAGVPLMIDNTVPSPYLCRPCDFGADIVVHSATKYIGGHGTTMGGVIVESGKFPWDNGKFPGMTEPSRGYHGVRFYETFGDFGYTMRARMEIMRTFGPALAPMAAWQLMQGLETLHVRMDRHCANALAVAQFLQSHPQVAWVNYPGLPDNKYHALAKKYLPKGASGLLNFGVKGGAKAGEKFIEAATFMSHLANIGDAKTLIIHPASTTHRQMSKEEQLKAGVLPDMVRMSVGLETLDDILWDIDQALSAASKA